MQKIALVNPPVPDDRNWVREGRCQQLDIWGVPFPPLSLALISRQLISRGNDTIVIDAGPQSKNLHSVISECRAFSPDFFVVTVATPTIETDLGWFLKEMKKEFPSVPLIAVGIHVSTLPVETMTQYPLLDYVVVGEPELSIAELVHCSGSESELRKVKGIAFRDQQGKIQVNPKREFVNNLDSLGLPDWSKIDFTKYTMPIYGKPFSMVHFARGCPFKCNYCTAHVYTGRVYRKRSVQNLIEEIEYNLSLGVQDFLFWTEMLTFDSRHLNEFLDALISKGLHKKIRWVCNSRVDTVSFEILKKMKRAGCWQIAFGFEFGDDSILAAAEKGGKASVQLGREAATLAHKAGLIVDGHFMLGYPGETEATLQKTIDFALSLPLTFCHFYSVVPYPGAEIYGDWSKEKKLTSWRKFDQVSPVYDTNSLSAETIARFKKSAYRRFYLRPSVVFRILSIPSTIKEFLNLARGSLNAFNLLIFR